MPERCECDGNGWVYVCQGHGCDVLTSRAEADPRRSDPDVIALLDRLEAAEKARDEAVEAACHAATRTALSRAIRAAKEERLEDPQTEEDAAYDRGVEGAVSALRRLRNEAQHPAPLEAAEAREARIANTRARMQAWWESLTDEERAEVAKAIERAPFAQHPALVGVELHEEPGAESGWEESAAE